MEISRNRTICSGFTLIELSVVLVLISILAYTAMSRFVRKDAFDEWGFTQEVLAALRYAHKYAIASGCDTGFVINAAGYQLNQRASCDSGGFTQALLAPGGDGSGYTAALPNGISVSAHDLFFDPIGRPWDRASGTKNSAVVTLSIGSASISVEPETGYVH